MSFRTKLIEKIKKDTGVEIVEGSKLIRPYLHWNNKSVGSFIWYFIDLDVKNTGSKTHGFQIGSSEPMRELMKAEKINCDFGKAHWGFYELSPS